MEKYIKVKFNDAELANLKRDATLHNKSVNQYIHDCTTGTELVISPVYAALEVSSALSEVRNALNEIFRRETAADVRLFEDDVIQIDQRMHNVEVAVAEYLKSVRKELK